MKKFLINFAVGLILLPLVTVATVFGYIANLGDIYISNYKFNKRSKEMKLRRR